MTKAARKPIDPAYKQKFIEDLRSFIKKEKLVEKDSTTCETVFSNSDNYSREKIFCEELFSNNFITSKNRGDALEHLVHSLFERIDLLHTVSITRKQTALGQLDLQLVTVKDYIYDLWDMFHEKPESEYIIGECKNYTNPVGRPEIERICWRASKGGCLSFFIATEYTEDAIDEVAYFNMNKNHIISKHRGVYIVPLSLSMINTVVEQNINFCYFVKWAIKASKIMSISNYLKLS